MANPDNSKRSVDAAVVEVTITLISGDRELRRFRSLSDAGAFLRQTLTIDVGAI